MSKKRICLFVGIILIFLTGCVSNQPVEIQTESNAGEETAIPVQPEVTNTPDEIEVLPPEELKEPEISQPEEEPEPVKTPMELYTELASGLKLEVVKTPEEIIQGGTFKSPYTLWCTSENNRTTEGISLTVEFPVSSRNDIVTWDTAEIITDKDGFASFTPEETDFPCNSYIYFYVTPQEKDEEVLACIKENKASAEFKIKTDKIYQSGVLAVSDYNSKGYPISVNTTCTSLQPPMYKAGFTQIGNAPFDSKSITKPAEDLYREAKEIFGSYISFLIYGTVKYTEPAVKMDDGKYKITLSVDISSMSLSDGEITYRTEFTVSETGKTEWDTLNKLRTDIIPKIVTEKLLYGM